MIAKLFAAGADAFRVNMSHGDQASKVAVIQAIRGLEKSLGRPTTILADLQGPKLRVGKFADGKVMLERAASSRWTAIRPPATPPVSNCRTGNLRRDRNRRAAVARRWQAVLHVTDHDADRIVTRVTVGGALSNSKGLNVPDVVLPMAALTPKDVSDMAFALDQGVDWIAMSFVQRPEIWQRGAS